MVSHQRKLKGNRPRFRLRQILVHPSRIQVGSVRPGQHTEFNSDSGEKAFVGQGGKNACIACRLDRRTIRDTTRAIVEGDRQPVTRQN
jgi:hypothetical protein